MATTAQTRLALAHQGQQGRLADQLAKLVLLQWRRNVTGPGKGGDAWLKAVTPAIRMQHRTSTNLARAYYATSRRLASPSAPSFVGGSPALEDEAIRASLVGSGLKFMSESLDAGHPLSEALTKGGGVASRAAARLALSGGREYIRDTSFLDSLAVGYYWQTREDGQAPCSWCAMLASRGMVYKDTSWPDADPRPDGRLKVSAHDRCACHLAPAWSRSQKLPDAAAQLYDDWLTVTKGYSGNDAINAWRRWYDSQQRLSAADLSAA